MHETAVAADDRESAWRAVFAALGANFIGVGFARFAYTPLIPALVAAHWFSPASAAYLGAANLAGYLAGALGARALAARLGIAPAVRAMMLTASLSFLACALPLSFLWYFLWRFAAGIAGGVLMALAPSAALQIVPPARRGLAGGVIFTGVGLGIAASGTLVPLLLERGLVAAWLGLGALSFAITAAAWSGWPRRTEPALSKPRHAGAPAGPIVALYLEYALNAAGLVPHMIFLVDFVARGLHAGLAAGARYWVVFGLGAMLGPLAAGRLADRIGFRATLRVVFLVQTAAVGLLAASGSWAALFLSSLLVGALVPGVVPVVLGRVHELVPGPERQQQAWARCAIAFAVGQAVAGYGFSYIFARSGGAYELLFALGAGLIAAGLFVDLAAGRRR
ncbi:MAG TPA: YbfB/YjiJ family MFS transporter [Stellaceae bacterium]|nr:YbfB/YjiJ family MFS transporter [Stellaceae bacterium]